MTTVIFSVVAYLILAPIIGGLLAGLDRVISARLQGRKKEVHLSCFSKFLHNPFLK